VMDKVMKFNPKGSFPTLVIDEKRCIVGFREAEIGRRWHDPERGSHRHRDHRLHEKLNREAEEGDTT